MNARPEKHVSSCSDNQAALKALMATKNNVPIHTAVPKGAERHFHSVFCGALLGPQTS